MNNAVLIQQVWEGDYDLGDYSPLLELTRERNEEYCKRHDFDFLTIIGTADLKYTDVRKGCWTKIELIQRAMEQGYEYIVWLDPDTLIKDMDIDLRLGCIDGIGVCWQRIPQLNHWNTGVIYVRNSIEAKKFIDEWFATYPGEPQWMEQGEFNKLAMKSKVVQTISDRWNATLNYSMVPDAVVLGFHGYGNAKQRLESMRLTLESLKR
jgi:hypothetical protein